MTCYGVGMGQAVLVDDLEGHMLITGYGSGAVEDRLSTCSAVIMLNAATGAAGLYHYPAGDIQTKPGARQLMANMQEAVQPKEVFFIYGISTDSGRVDKPVPTDPFHMALLDFLRLLLPLNTRIGRNPAMMGRASIKMDNGKCELGHPEQANLVSLERTLAGSYAKYTMYRDGD